MSDMEQDVGGCVGCSGGQTILCLCFMCVRDKAMSTNRPKGAWSPAMTKHKVDAVWSISREDHPNYSLLRLEGGLDPAPGLRLLSLAVMRVWCEPC